MAKDIYEYVSEYEAKFGEPLPMMCLMSVSDARIIEIIKECLAKGEPYEPPHINDPDVLY